MIRLLWLLVALACANGLFVQSNELNSANEVSRLKRVSLFCFFVFVVLVCELK